MNEKAERGASGVKRVGCGVEASVVLRHLARQCDPCADNAAGPARVLCGRWLLLRRIELGLTYAQLAAHVGLAPELQLLVETGLADETLVCSGARACLVAALATHGDCDWVARVLWAALSTEGASDACLLVRVSAELAEQAPC